MLDRRCHATFVPGDPPRLARLALWQPERAGGRSSESAAPDPTAAPEELVELVLPGLEGVEAIVLPATLHPLSELLDELFEIAPDAPGVSASLRAWALVSRHALELIARGRLQPAITASGADTWALGPLDDADRSVRAALASWIPPAAHCLRADPLEPLRVTDPADAIASFCQSVADVMPRTAAAGTVSRQPAWCATATSDISALRSALSVGDISARTVVGLRVSLPDSLDLLGSKDAATLEAQLPGLRDDEPHAVVTGEHVEDSWSVRVELQVRSGEDPALVASAEQLWQGTAIGFGTEAETDLLLALRRGARLWAPLAQLLDQSEPSGLEVADLEALELFGPLADELGGVGIEVLVPSSLTRTLRAVPHAGPSGPIEGRPGAFSLDAVCELTWRATLDGAPVSDAELAQLAASRRPLVRLRDSWVVVDPGVLARLGRRSELSAANTLAGALGAQVEVDGELVELTVSGPVVQLADRLRAASQPHELAEPDGLHATLRPYQRRGVAWLNEMTELGFGGVLADDMGLGKTIQLIAVHLHRVERTSAPTLVVCPATLVGNWQRELERFAPGLVVHRYHGSERTLHGVEAGAVVITTYGIARRDAALLAERTWGLVVADEAQQIKNPSSATARAMRRLHGEARIAMTGTPVENRLDDLWSLLDWTTPGLLGPLESFRRSVAIPVERDRDLVATERFSRLVGPFLLRRRKDDPDVVPDLPPKTETDHPVTLSAEQAGLYRAVLDEVMAAIEQAQGIERRGLVLKLITALKQVCNHPAHYLGQAGPLAGRSGKLDALDELVGAIVDAGDATLLFTQYVAMGELLMARLAELGIPAQFLHGSTSLEARSRMVESFQDGGFPVFVLSLKAGGTGLNLTRATHVIHYDRWWNPAVENQASDRAWRIGQDRPVQVHRLISDGTIEDRIAAVLDQKRQLADEIVGGGEAWLTELDDRALAELVRLGDEQPSR